MTIPKKLKIGGHVFKIVRAKLEDAHGMCDIGNNTITISNKLTKSQAEVTLLHEILHATNAQWDENSNMHLVMESIAQQLYQVLSDNKMLK